MFKNSKKNKAFIFIIILMAIDSMILTAYGFQKFDDFFEMNPIHNFGFEKFGVAYPFFAFPFVLIFIFFLFKVEQRIINWSCKKERIPDRNYVFKTMITVICFQIIAILNNLYWIFT